MTVLSPTARPGRQLAGRRWVRERHLLTPPFLALSLPFDLKDPCLCVWCCSADRRSADASKWFYLDATGAGTPQHGLSSDTMALITSDCGTTCSPNIKWP